MIWLIAFFSCLFLVSLDQLVKYWATVYLQPVGSMNLIDGLIGLHYGTNPGMAFGFLEGFYWLFIPLTIIILTAMLIYYGRLPRGRKYLAARVPMIFIFSGAIGNFIDRVRFQEVVDMFEFQFMDFAIFNVADICIVCGTIVFAFVTLFALKEEEKSE